MAERAILTRSVSSSSVFDSPGPYSAASAGASASAAHEHPDLPQELLLRIENMLRAAEYEGAFEYLILALARAAEAIALGEAAARKAAPASINVRLAFCSGPAP